MPAVVKYTAWLYQDRESDQVEVTVIRDVQAGISGPDVSFKVEAVDLNAVDIELAQRGYTRTGDWTLSTSYQGLNLAALIEPSN